MPQRLHRSLLMLIGSPKRQLDGWNVDVASPEKILTVQTTDNRIGELIIMAVKQAGYKAEPIHRP